MTTLTMWAIGTMFAVSSFALAQESFPTAPAAPPVSQAPVMGNESPAATATPSAPKRSKKHKKQGKKVAKKALKQKRQRTQ